MLIGITGGVGAGKSTVLKYIQKVRPDAKVFLLDDEAKKLQKQGLPMYEAIVKEFGENILLENREIDRAKLASVTFSNSENLKELNTITLPFVLEHIENLLKENKNELIFFESAILLDTCIKDMCNQIWYIYADCELRRTRLRINRGYSNKRITDMFKRQRRDIYFRNRCQVVIPNTDMQNMQKSVEEALKNVS